MVENDNNEEKKLDEKLIEAFAKSQEEDFEILWGHTFPIFKEKPAIKIHLNLSSVEVIEALKTIAFVFYCSGVGDGLEKGTQPNFGLFKDRN